MAGSQALPPGSMSHRAAQALREAIISRRLKSGERLVELKLAASFQIGQPTVREALHELEYQGFVRRIPHRGTYVANLTNNDFQKIHEVRMALEPMAFERAARRISPETALELKALVDSMEAAARKSDRIGFHNCDLEFHRKVWQSAGNEYLASILEQTLFGMFAFVLHEQPDCAFLDAVKQHRDSLRALLSGDPARARRVFLRSTAAFWKKYHHVALVHHGRG